MDCTPIQVIGVLLLDGVFLHFGLAFGYVLIFKLRVHSMSQRLRATVLADYMSRLDHTKMYPTALHTAVLPDAIMHIDKESSMRATYILIGPITALFMMI
jgi:hypothetical protein